MMIVWQAHLPAGTLTRGHTYPQIIVCHMHIFIVWHVRTTIDLQVPTQNAVPLVKRSQRALETTAVIMAETTDQEALEIDVARSACRAGPREQMACLISWPATVPKLHPKLLRGLLPHPHWGLRSTLIWVGNVPTMIPRLPMGRVGLRRVIWDSRMRTAELLPPTPTCLSRETGVL